MGLGIIDEDGTELNPYDPYGEPLTTRDTIQEQIGLTDNEYDVAGIIHGGLAKGSYDENLIYRVEDPLSDRLQRDTKFRELSNQDIRNGTIAALQYPSDHLGKHSNSVPTEAVDPVEIPPAIQAKLDELLPKDQVHPYSGSQITLAMNLVENFMTLPPVLNQYHEQELKNNPDARPIVVMLQDQKRNFSAERGQAAIAATLANVGGNVEVEIADKSKGSGRDKFVRDPLYIGPDNTVYIPTQARRC